MNETAVKDAEAWKHKKGTSHWFIICGNALRSPKDRLAADERRATCPACTRGGAL